MVAERGNRQILRVDLATGAREVVTSDDVGSGPPIGSPRRLFIVPEAAGGSATRLSAGLLAAAAVVVLAVGVGAVVALRRR